MMENQELKSVVVGDESPTFPSVYAGFRCLALSETTAENHSFPAIVPSIESAPTSSMSRKAPKRYLLKSLTITNQRKRPQSRLFPFGSRYLVCNLPEGSNS